LRQEETVSFRSYSRIAGQALSVASVLLPVAVYAQNPNTILWFADHEEGNLSDWYTPSGGGEFNSGSGVSTASTDFAHGGLYSAKATISTPPSPSAVRLFRWAESRVNPEAYYSAWFYFPRIYTPSWWFIDQFKSRRCSTCDPDPFWFVQVGNRSNGNMYARLVWWYGPWPGGTEEGPHAGEFGGRTYEQTIMDLPTNQWVHIEIFLRQSAGFDGQIIVWQDGVEIFNQNNVKTRYPYMGDEWSPGSCAGSISPSPATIYIDDAAISTARLGPGTSDTTPPTVSLSAPAPGATLSGTVTVSASASDNVGVAGVQFKLDGSNLGAEDTASPFSISWNSVLALNGSHSLTAVARDAAGNTAVGAPVSVTVSNAATPSCQLSGASWQNQAFAPQSGTFTAQFDATPAAANIDGVIGLSASSAADYTDLAAIVRFNSSGNIDARNGGAYSALAAMPYVAEAIYRVRMALNVPAHSYSVYVTPPGGSEQALALNYAFRSEQAAATTLSALASITNGGILQICNFTVATSEEIFADFGTNGLWSYGSNGWTFRSTLNPVALEPWGGKLAVAFGSGNGIYTVDGTRWTYLSSLEPTHMVAWGDRLVVAFASGGLWIYDASGWTNLTSWNPEHVVAWGEKLAVAFGSGNGLWYYDATGWNSITSWDPYDVVAWDTTLAVAFDAGRGLWRYDTGTWTQLTAAEPLQTASWNGQLVATIANSGLWSHDGAAWRLLTGWVPYDIEPAGGALLASFDAGRGVWQYSSGTWRQITVMEPVDTLATASRVYVDLGPDLGLFRYQAGAWSGLTVWSSEELAVVPTSP
jgi:hypothetical protein